jgi:hypothetical protein
MPKAGSSLHLCDCRFLPHKGQYFCGLSHGSGISWFHFLFILFHKTMGEGSVNKEVGHFDKEKIHNIPPPHRCYDIINLTHTTTPISTTYTSLFKMLSDTN